MMNKLYLAVWLSCVCMGFAHAKDPVLFSVEEEPQVERPAKSFSAIPAPQAPNAPQLKILPMEEEDLPFDDGDEDGSDFEEESQFNIRPQEPQRTENSIITLPPAQNETKPAAVNGESLTDALEKEPIEKPTPLIQAPKIEGTWVEKITEKAGSKIKGEGSKPEQMLEDAEGTDSLESMVKSSTPTKRRSNAAVFDVSGVMLRMSPKQIDDAMKKRGFRKTSETFEIPNFIKWRNEEKCRNLAVTGYERLNACVIEMAKKDKHQYLETVKYTRFASKEDVVIKLTSNFTNNKAYKISYKSLAPTVTGNSEKATYLRNIKVYDFWKKVNQKYGSPDNKDEIVWGLGGNKPYLRAASGILVLEDPMLRELDYTRMSREDQRFINTDIYSF